MDDLTKDTYLTGVRPLNSRGLRMFLGLATTTESAVLPGASLVTVTIWEIGDSLNHSHPIGN